MTKPDPRLNWVRLPLSGASNARDLGGYPTSDGRQTAFHQFVRMNSLEDLTPEDEEFLHEYGIRTVIDLRDAHELVRFPDRYIDRPDVDYHHIGLLAGNAADPDEIERLFGESFTIQSVYRLVVENTERAGEVFRAIVNAKPGGVAFHCAVGKDRTGFVAMVLLLVAGCDRADVVANYVQSRYNLERDPRFVRRFEAAPDWEKPFMDSQAENMKMSLDLIEAHGGIYAYLRECGLSEEEIDQLRTRVLGDVAA